MFLRASAVLLALAVLCRPAEAGVVINEVLYHAPDDLDDLQFIELHNTTDRPIDLTGWRLARSVTYKFPAKKIEANGYLVVCKDLKELKKHYGLDGAGAFAGRLPHNR